MWSIVLELDIDDPNPVRERLLVGLREQGFEVRSKTIKTSQLELALRPVDVFRSKEKV